MAIFRIALVLVCLTAVGATCPEGEDAETCSQRDTGSLLQVIKQSVATVDSVIGGLAQVAAGDVTCTECMDLLETCLDPNRGGATVGVGDGNTAADNPEDDECFQWEKKFGTAAEPEYQAILCASKNPLAKGMPDYDLVCGNIGVSSTSPAPGAGSSPEAGGVLLQQEAAHHRKGNVTCANPSSDAPSTWACGCMKNMVKACKDEEDKQACFNVLLCGDDRIDNIWKKANCETHDNGCDKEALLVETNTSMKARAKEARVKEDTSSAADEASLDESLSGKRASCE